MMVPGWLGLVFVWLTLAACGFLFFVVVAYFQLLRLYNSVRPGGMEREARLLAHPLPPDAELPHVVLQIPTFNEGAIVERAIESCARLDWPRDRFHIQVCDDSTDETTAFARAAAARAVAAGVDVVVLHREDRTEFKAGALREAMARTPHDYFAILDVDYVPERDWIRRCMAVLLAEPRLAFAQGRPDYLNRDANALTRAQAIILDFHYALEQATRSWTNQVLPFNGTCGIWRRAAIEAGGGWRGDALTEDWDLAYRASRNGWHGMFLVSVPVPGELPTGFGAWVSQQKRWAAGVGEVARKNVPSLLTDRSLSTGERMGALMPLATWLGYVMFTLTLFLAAAAMLLAPWHAFKLSLVLDAAYLGMGAALFALMRAVNRCLGRGTPLSEFLRDFPLVLALSICISWFYFQSAPGTLLDRRRIFVRTPKQGSVESPS